MSRPASASLRLGNCREPGRPARQQADHRGDPVFRRARLVIAGDLTVGELVAFNMLAGRVSGADPAAGAALAGFPAGADSRSSGSATSSTRPPEPTYNPGRASAAADQRRRSTFEQVTLPLPPRRARGAARTSASTIPAGRGGRHRRPVRLGQSRRSTKLVQRLYVPGAGPGAGRRRRPRAGRSGLAAPPDRRRAAGEHPVQPHGAREHRARRSRHADGAR